MRAFVFRVAEYIPPRPVFARKTGGSKKVSCHRDHLIRFFKNHLATLPAILHAMLYRGSAP